ncbi:glycosyltransferase [Clostridium perfringens]|nr:glycosyltransferase [Clostridium perfringens]MDK0665320.1 glycosyltransferase [Clostridium perfringens]
MKEITVIGQFPPPMHGLSKALDTMYNSRLNEKFKLKKIDLTNNKKFLFNLKNILKSNSDLYYFTISQSKLGNIRDIIIIKSILYKNKKIVLHLHGGGFKNLLEENVSKFQKKLNLKVLKNIDGVIVLGKSLKYIFEGIVDEKKIFVVKNCVDDEFVITDVEFNEKIKKLKVKKKMKILYLSNFIEDKGYKEVLKLAKYFKDINNKNFEFLFAGKFFNDNDESEFFKYIEKNNLHEIIKYLGVVGGEQKINLLKESDYFILITKYKNEGQPISIIEAAANGLRVISTDHAGIKDIVDKNEMICVDKNIPNIIKIAEYLNFEFNNRNEVVNILINNRRKILRDFSQDRYIEDLERVFNQVKS